MRVLKEARAPQNKKCRVEHSHVKVSCNNRDFSFSLSQTNRIPIYIMAAPHITGRTKPTKPKKQQRAIKRKRDDVDVEKLEQQVQDLVRLFFFFSTLTALSL
jgi:hypothetical protein